MFVPQKDILFAGFSTYAPTVESKYFLKYKVEVDGEVKVDQSTPIQCTKFEETYYNRVHLATPFRVAKSSKIQIFCWISKDFASNSNVYTYYGNEGNDYASVENEHMELFEIQTPGDNANGTSLNNGQLPEVFYHLLQ